MNRRNFLKDSALLATGVLAIPDALQASLCPVTHGIVAPCEPTNTYTQLDVSLVHTAQAYMTQAAKKAVNHNLDPTTWAYAKYYNNMLTNHLSIVSGKQINENLRWQYIAANLPTWNQLSDAMATSLYNSVVSGWSASNGNDALNMANAVLPAVQHAQGDILYQVEHIGVYGALDNINAFQNQYIASITASGGNPCGLAPWQIDNLKDLGGLMGSTAGFIGFVTPFSGEAAPFLGALAAGFGLLSYGSYMLARMCTL